MHNWNLCKKLLLTKAVLIAVAAPILFGQVNKTQSQPTNVGPLGARADNLALIAPPEYEVASIKPNKSGKFMGRMEFTPDGFTATGVTLPLLISTAYGIKNKDQMSGAPNWATSERYDVEAKADTLVVDELRKLTEDQRELVQAHMLQALLEDRFQFKYHRETKELSAYALVIAKNGPKLQVSKSGEHVKDPDVLPTIMSLKDSLRMGQLVGKGFSMAEIADMLTYGVERPVVDKTELKGSYDFTLHWTPVNRPPMVNGASDSSQGLPANAPELDSPGPSIFTAVQEQLGLKLIPQKVPVVVLVFDHVERPSEN